MTLTPALTIETPSLRLRVFDPLDAAPIMALNAEPSTRDRLPSHVYPDRAAAQAAVDFLRACVVDPGDPRRGPYVLAAEHRDSGVLIGHVGFSPLDDEVEISYAIGEAVRGRGYGCEAVVHACRWVAETFGLHRVLALTARDNVASVRTLEKACFVHLRDEERLFQGRRQWIRRYVWTPSGTS